MTLSKEQFNYNIQFDFTTVHRGSQFIGRTGQCDISSKVELTEDNKEDDDLKSFCAYAIRSHNPKWKIFMINIKTIQPCQ